MSRTGFKILWVQELFLSFLAFGAAFLALPLAHRLQFCSFGRRVGNLDSLSAAFLLRELP
jgi:hypothetical protein